MTYWKDLGFENEERARKILSIVGTIVVLIMAAIALYCSDWDWKQLAISFRVMFVRVLYVIMLWTPGFLCDLYTDGDNLECIGREPQAMSQFYGYMGIATAIVIAWGPA